MIVNENEKVDLSGIRYCSFLDTNIISSQYGIVLYDSLLFGLISLNSLGSLVFLEGSPF